MGKPKDDSEDSGLIHISFDQDVESKIIQMALDVLESHDNLDEAFQGMTIEKRLSTVMLISKQLDLHPLHDFFLRERVKRHFEVDPVRFIGAHHFSQASAECIKTYRAGYFIACTMMTQSINEGIINFVAERNSIKAKRGGNLLLTIDKFVKHGLFTNEAAQASKVICERDERNDIHHMKPEISQIEDWHELAKRNLRNLAKVETCVFGNELVDGAICPRFPQHWDSAGEDMVQIHMR